MEEEEAGDDQRRPATVTNDTSRSTAGSITGRLTTPGTVALNSGKKHTPIPAATIVRIQSSRSLRYDRAIAAPCASHASRSRFRNSQLSRWR